MITSARANNVIYGSVANDLDGCGNGSTNFSITLPNDGYQIRAVEFILAESSSVHSCTSTWDPCVYRYWENPE